MSDYARAAEYASLLHFLFWDGVVTQDEINAVARANFGLPEGDDYPMQPPPDDYVPPHPPVNVDVPHVTGTPAVDSVLNCTKGNWDGMEGSSGYAYQWKRGATNIGTNSADYTVVAADQGNDITCVVTASNAHGSTAAPPSNAVSIPAPLEDK